MHAILQNQERPIENYCAHYLTNWTPDDNDYTIMFYALKILIGLPVVGTVYIASFIWNRITELICASDEIRKTDSVSESIKSNIQLKSPGYKVIEPNEDGRQSHMYLYTNRWSLVQLYEHKSEKGYRGHDKLTKQQYESLLINSLECKEFIHPLDLYVYDDGHEHDLEKWGGKQYREDYPINYIHQNTTPIEFYRECAKRPTYQLHHGDPIMGVNALTTSAFTGNLKLLEELLKVAPELVNLENRDGITPLFRACMYKNKEVALDMARLLIENGANVNFPCFYCFTDNDLSIEDTSTPLSVAAKRGNEELVQLLLNNGAIIMRKDDYANTDEVKEDRKLFVRVTPEKRPYFYGLKTINVNFIISQARSLTEKKALPLVKWGFSEKIPMDILGKVVQIFQHLLKFY